MAGYVDAFIIPLPKKNQRAYLSVAKHAAKLWVKSGALQYVETLGDEVPKGKITSFPRSIKLKGTEKVILGFAVYKSKAHRNQVLKKVMKNDELMKLWEKYLPDAGERMIFGGFKSLASSKR